MSQSKLSRRRDSTILQNVAAEAHRQDGGFERIKHRSANPAARWIVTTVWIALILLFGTPLFSLVRTSGMLSPLISRIAPIADPGVMYQIQVFIRRSAHVVEYAILFVLLNLGPLRGRPIVAFIVCIGVAAIDELLQTLTPARSGKISDVAEDASGAAIAMVLAMPHWDRLRDLRRSARAVERT